MLETAPLVHRSQHFDGKVKRLKYCLRGLLTASCTIEWFAYLHTQKMESITKNQPHLYHKLQRPYLNRLLNTRQRLEALKQHYDYIVTSFPPPMMDVVFGNDRSGLILAVIPMIGVGDLELRLISSNWGQREGDLMIQLLDIGSVNSLFSISFSILKLSETHKEIFIGGLQGRKIAHRDHVILITRRLNGLRPKALLFFTLQQLAFIWGINSIRAVSDDLQVYRHIQKRRKISASYNKFWTECGGKLSSDGMFVLPPAFVAREISAIKVTKRKLYKRRYDMLAGFADQIRCRLSPLNTLCSGSDYTNSECHTEVTWDSPRELLLKNSVS